MEENIKVYALGGLNENGKSLYVVEYNDQLYIFDAGLRYPEESLLGIDIILPGYQYLISRKDSIKGFFLTHGHDENMGALPFILEEMGTPIDVYCTSFTLVSLYQTAERFNKDIHQARFHVIDGNQSFLVNGMKIHAFSVTHGVPNACGYALETQKGLIVYSGDFILDFSQKAPYDTNLSRIMDIAKKPTLLLLAESYNASYKGFVAPNNLLSNRLSSICDEVKGRIFISIYGQTVFQLQEIFDCARQSKRKIFLYTKQVKELVALLKNDMKVISVPDNLFTSNIFDRYCIVVVSELGNKVFEKLNEIAVANDTEKSLRINEDDAFVIASPAHAGTELSFARILDKLYMTNAKVYNISKDYISMHAGSEDLKTMISIFKPKYYMPVRGYYNKMVENAKLALAQGYNHSNILVYDNGMIASFKNGEIVRTYDTIESSEIMVDGIGIGDVENVVINDRRKLQQDGVLILGVSFSMSTRKIVAGPDIQMKGFILNRSATAFVEKVSKCYSKTVYDFVQKPGLVDFNELRNLCKEKIQALVKEEVDREPMILPVIISV
ncbi:MAG: ribonuclease J [Erysipelotrichaceae bacterium]|nr:ribonuclease J [Erysipelotrichaceae bacterium]